MRLNVFEVEKIDDLKFKTIDGNLTKESSIMEIFTDFNNERPMVIQDHAHTFEVREIMQREHVRMKMVVDANNHFLGILPLAELTEEKLLAKKKQGYDEETLLVKHCMIAKAKLQALDYQEITAATIGDTLDALQHIGSRYCLVVDHKEHQIRGVISANDISRALHEEVHVSSTGVGTTFLDIFMRMSNQI